MSILQLLATAAMTGLIWKVQLVSYPAFRLIPQAEFSRCHRFHSTRIAWIVIPLMFLEMTTASWLLITAPTVVQITAYAMLIGIWLSTFLLQVPLHRRLAREQDQAAIDRLVHTNWLRTILWTARAALLAIDL